MSVNRLAFAIVLFTIHCLTAGCKTMPSSKTPTASSSLATQLTETGYESLFLTQDLSDLQALVDQFGEAAFDDLVRDSTASYHPRLLAAEGLFALQKQPTASAAQLAQIYVAALEQQFLNIANPWGTPKALGNLSKRILEFGADAVPFLIDLLGNTTVLSYAGSREATSGNLYQYRIKDLAASLICAIRGVTYVFQQDFGERDAWIVEHLGK
jgi:hypothetical protein